MMKIRESFSLPKAGIPALCLIVLLSTGCATSTGGGPAPGEQKVSTRPLNPVQAQRLQQVMTPLIQAMNKPIPLDKVKITLIDDKQINAANAGGGNFYVTTGLLQKASDDQLRGVLAHEIAHADLGHVAKAQVLGTGLNIGTIILNQIIPGSGLITPIIADLGVMKPYSRTEEYQADAHGVEILNKAGFNGKQIMAGTLSWLLQTEGPSGGFFATHPGTQDRIQRIESMP